MTEKQNTAIAIREELDNKILTVLGSEKFPLEIRSKIDKVLDIVKNNKTMVDLYPNELAEIPMSSSCFQDTCVQYGEHFTPHRRLRQALLEMQNRLEGLDAAKNGQKKSYVKMMKIEGELKIFERIYNKLLDSPDIITKDIYIMVSSYVDIDNNIAAYILKEGHINSKDLYDVIMSKIKVKIGFSYNKYEETKRNSKSNEHMVKDSAIKVAQQQELVNKFNKEVEDSGLSFEESEVYYYIMFFTSEAYKQLQTMGRVDTGTYGVISQTPTPIRLKILSNIEILRKKVLEEKYSMTAEYIWKEHPELFLPKKTGDNEIEGMNVSEFLSLEDIKILSKT